MSEMAKDIAGRSEAMRPTRSKSVFFLSGWRKWGVYYLFLAPFMTLFLVFTIIPVLAAGFLSFTYFNMLESPKFIGIENYRLLFVEDDIFLTSVKNTLTFAFVTGPVGFLLSFTFAWLIHQMRYKAIYSLAIYAPSLTSAVVIGVFFRDNFFSGDKYGILNHLLLSAGVLDEPFIWLQNVRTVLPVIIGVTLWTSMNTGFLIWLAGFNNVPEELYEAGRIDGVQSRFQEVWYITLPYMKPQILLNSVLATVAALGVFSITFELAGLPSPLYAAHTIVAHLFDYAFIRFEMGYASAIAVVLFMISFGLSQMFFRVFGSDDT